MNFHSSTPKTDCKNENTRSKLWENSCFDFYNTFHVARNNLQDTFQCMEKQGNNMKDTVFFYLMNFHSSTPKLDCKNKNTRSKLWENSCFDIYNTIHVAKNNPQDTIKCISTQNHPKQITEIKTPYLNSRKILFFIFMTACIFSEILVCVFVK